MIQHPVYTIKIDGVTYVYCDTYPEPCDIIKENLLYTPDEGKVFTKDGEYFDSVFIHDESIKIEDYIEIVDPRPQPEETI